MTEETNNVQDVTASAHGLGEDGKTDGNEMPENNQLAYDTYKKALNQRHKFKSENEALKAELEAVKSKLDALENNLRDRVETLERIITNPKEDLKRQFDHLDKAS